MDLERDEIERTDFAQARRGYDPEEVDRHLAEIAASVVELKRAADEAQRPRESSGTGGLAAAAAEQVRTIVDAAERSAAEIEASARAEAERVTGDAKRQAEEDRNAAQADAQRTRSEAAADAQETLERAEAAAAAHVSKVEDATTEMLRRADTAQTTLGGLVDELGTTVGSLVENVRTGAGSLQSELQGIRSGLADIRDAAPSAAAAAGVPPLAQERVRESVLDEPEAGDLAADAELEPHEPLTAHDEDVEPVETTAGDFDEPAVAVGDSLADEPAVADEPEVEVAGAGDAAGGGGDGSEGARLIALNMALNGTPRDETARYLEENFDLADRDTILDEVYSRVGG